MTAPEEASSEARTFARQIRNLYVALVAEGFTSEAAMELLGHVLTNSEARHGRGAT